MATDAPGFGLTSNADAPVSQEEAVATIEKVLGKLRVREPRKIEHAIEQFEAHLDLAKLDEALGLA